MVGIGWHTVERTTASTLGDRLGTPGQHGVESFGVSGPRLLTEEIVRDGSNTYLIQLCLQFVVNGLGILSFKLGGNGKASSLTIDLRRTPINRFKRE